MVENAPTSSSRNMHAIILGVLGILLVIVGEAIINIRGMPFRGSGLGTLAVIAGVILLIIAALRFLSKRH
jgi:hypothetical protein